jgi:hypothetical protein
MINFIKNLLLSTTAPDGEEKIRNAIAFFASEHERLTHKPLSVSSLHRYLALLDHTSMEKTGRPVFGLGHRTKWRLLTESGGGRKTTRKQDCFVLIPGRDEYLVKATREPNLSYFSSFELDEMKGLAEVNADRLTKVLHRRFSSLETEDRMKLDQVSAELVANTPEMAWTEIDVSEHSFFNNREEVGEMAGLGLLMEKYEAQLKELETQMAEVKRKLKIVTEASNLLREEGLSDDEPQPRWP